MNQVNRIPKIKEAREERSLGELFSDLSAEMQRLFRDELALIKSELSDQVSRGLKDAAYVAVGGALLYAGMLTIIGAAVALLGLVMPVWVSALIIGLLVVGGGYFMVRKGLNDLKQADFTPKRTISTLKEDKEWLKKAS